MLLTREQKSRVEAAAESLGVDPAEMVALAEQELAGEEPTEGKPGGRPTNERLLVGHLPYIKVRELREVWLGLTERIPDDEMTCGEYAAKHGGPAAPATTTPEPE